MYAKQITSIAVFLILILALAGAATADTFGSGPVFTVDLPIARPLAVAYAPDGKQIAVGGLESIGDAPNDGLVLLVDEQNGSTQAALRHSGTLKLKHGSSGSSNMLWDLAYSPDGKTLAVAAELGLKLWDTADGKDLATLIGYGIDETNRQILQRSVTSVAFSPDGKLLAVARSPIEIWDVESRKPLREMNVHGDTGVTFSKDGSLLASASYRNHVRLWSVADGKEVGDVHAEMGPLYGVAIDRQGERLAVAGGGGAKLWRIEKTAAGQWKFNDETRLTSPRVRYVAFSPDGRVLATAGERGALVIYDPQTRQIVGTLLAGGPFAFSPDGKSLAVAQRLVERSPDGHRQDRTSFSLWKTTDLLSADRMAEQARAAAMEMVRTLESSRPGMMQGVLAVLSGPQTEVATPILVDALNNPLVNEKQLLIFALACIADRDAKARAAIIVALRTAEAVDVRTVAAGMLGQLPADAGKEAVPALVEAALNDESPQVRSTARRTLAKLDPKAFQQLSEQARARGPVVDRVERRNGKLVYQGRSLEEWIKLYSVTRYAPNETRPDKRMAAIRAMGPDAVPQLIETLKNGERPLRQAAARGLEALGVQAAPAVDPLMDIIATATIKDLSLAGGAADALGAILKDQKKPPTRLEEMTNSDDPAVRLSAARAVAVMAPEHPRGVPVLKVAMAATGSSKGIPLMRIRPFPEQPSVSWLGRVIADNEAPPRDRIRAAESLAQIGEAAAPALPEMLKAIAVQNRSVVHQTTLSIQTIGPKAIPSVRDALAAATEDGTRQRLATILWGLGDEGRSTLKEFLQGKEGSESEALWWAAVSGSWDRRAGMGYQTAARSALIRAGKEVPPQQRQFGANSPDSPDRFPSMFQPPSVAWLMKLLTDNETPRTIRIEAGMALGPPSADDTDIGYGVPLRARRGELLPYLPTLLKGIVNEQDRTIISQFANVIRWIGPQAIPAVKDAIDKVQSDYTRRALLSALSGLGKEGHREFVKYMQNNPEYRQLFWGKSNKGQEKEE